MLLVSCIRAKENAVTNRHSLFTNSLQIVLNGVYNDFINHSNNSFACFIITFTSDMGGGAPIDS